MEQYQVVSNRTNSLHQVSEQLLADQVLSYYLYHKLCYLCYRYHLASNRALQFSTESLPNHVS
jgi:hypothetical protein